MHTALPFERHGTRARIVIALGVVVALLGFASAALPLLAIPAMTLGIILFLAQPERARASRRLLIAASPFVLIALVRFTIEEAVPGIVEGGHRALVTRSVAKLRSLRFAQDIAREQAVWDPDGDGVGSALFLEELAAVVRVRGQKDAPRGLMQPIGSFAKTPFGTAVVADGYALIVYLPGPDGRGTAAPGSPVDDERAERRFVAYAWPLEEGVGDRPVVFLDEHERVLLLENRAPGPRYFGLEHPPPFDAALTADSLDAPAAEGAIGQDGGLWRPWKDKTARQHLPGDR